MLEKRKAEAKTPCVFAESVDHPMLNSSLDHLHKKLRETLKISADFVLHFLRHTSGTRLGEAGADAFTIMRLMGHRPVTTSQHYVHPAPEALERAVERLTSLNQKAANNLLEAPKGTLLATVSAPASEPVSVSY